MKPNYIYNTIFVKFNFMTISIDSLFHFCNRAYKKNRNILSYFFPFT